MKTAAPATTTLVRTMGGQMVHRAECHMANRGKAMPWRWADTVPPEHVVAAIKHFGYRRCRFCRPLERYI